MKQLTNLTADPKQKYDIILDDNSILELTLEFIDSQQGWNFIITRNDFTAKNRRLVVGLNILNVFKNIIPFGICVASVDNLDPAFIDDFTSGRITVYILNQNDIEYLEENENF